ncbi:MAG: SRPBCC domain-containing protein [Ignavibacteria bacterium]|nr:SRPBCC domain-containing protein [Ignavibacteria bacterium]
MKEKSNTERAITAEIIVPAPLPEVWRAWTTKEGAESFFAPRCNVGLRPGGAYEMLFNLDVEPGKQGGEGMIVMAVQPEQMLAFTWNAPPDLPAVRGQMTHVVIRLFARNAASTHVTLRHDGWGEGGEWDAAFSYFSRAWGEVVLPRLKYRFERGPIDWNNPPKLDRNLE